jgi:hypothetical protein
MKRVGLLFAVLLSSAVTSAFAVETSSPKSELSTAIDIKIETSRSQPTVGSGLGLIAEIQNVSNNTLYFKERSVVLSLPPELLGPFSSTALWWGIFPTQHTYTPAGQEEPFNGKVTLRPSATYRIFWSSTPSIAPAPIPGAATTFSFATNMLSLVASELNFIFFTPGDYKVSVVAEYWDKREFPDEDYHTFSQTATIRVAAPQSVILFGAGVGGLLAYFILLVNRRQGRISIRRRFGRVIAILVAILVIITTFVEEIARMMGAVLLSAMVTILLSRISETQFLVRVTVNDFWGAIAIGFIASWVGSRTIEKFLPQRSEDRSRATPQVRT